MHEDNHHQTSEMAQRGKHLPCKPDSLNPIHKPQVEGKDQFLKVFSWPPHLCCTPALRTTTRFLVPPSKATQIIQVRLNSSRVYFNTHSWLTALPLLPDLQTLNKDHPKMEK